MRKLFLHIGFAKCGSTSLQYALSTAPNILYPTSGNHNGEHLAFALSIRGIDEWTSKIFDHAWVQGEQVKLMVEIASNTDTVVLSSERLAAMSEAEIARVANMFGDFDVSVILLRRQILNFLSSTWRHAVFWHDYGESFEDFLIRYNGDMFREVEEKFRSYFPVHVFEIESPNYAQDIGLLIGTSVEFRRDNEGIPMELARLLQKLHLLLGSKEFKSRFSMETKQSMLAVWSGSSTTEIQPLDVLLF